MSFIERRPSAFTHKSSRESFGATIATVIASSEPGLIVPVRVGVLTATDACSLDTDELTDARWVT